MKKKCIGVLGDTEKVQRGQIHPKNMGTTLLGKSLNLKCLGEGLGECRGEACPIFIFFTRHLLWLLLVTAPWARCTCSLTQTNFSYKPRLPRSLRQPIYNTGPIKIALSVAAVNAAGGCALPEFRWERGDARKKAVKTVPPGESRRC